MAGGTSSADDGMDEWRARTMNIPFGNKGATIVTIMVPKVTETTPRLRILEIV